MDYDIGYSLLGKLVDWIWAERYCSKGIDSDFKHMKQALEKPRETAMDDGEKAVEVIT